MLTTYRAWNRLALAGAIIAVLLLTGVSIGAVPPRQDDRISVFVSHTGEDAAGLLFVQHVKAALTQSSSVVLAATGDLADTVLFVTTMEPDATRSGRLTTAGWTLVILRDVNVYVASGLRFCEREQSQKAATGLVAYVESLIASRATDLPRSAARLRYEADWNEEVDRAAETLPIDTCGVKVQTAFREQMGTYLRLSVAAGLKLDVREVIKSVSANLAADDDFARKIRDQAARLGACQAELAAIKKK